MSSKPSDQVLRRAVVKLAAKHPEHAADLYKALGKSAVTKTADWGNHIFDTIEHAAKRSDLKPVVQGDKVRVYRDRMWSLFAVEVPQKPLKRRKVSVMQMYYGPTWGVPGEDAFLVSNILQDAKLSKSDDFSAVERKIKQALEKAEKRMLETWEKQAETNPKLQGQDPTRYFPRMETGEVNYLRVPPAEVKPFTAKGANFEMRVTWQNFEAYSPDSDFQQSDPHYTKYEAKSPAAARKLFKILHGEPTALKSVKWSDLSQWLNDKKVAFDIHFSNWS